MAKATPAIVAWFGGRTKKIPVSCVFVCLNCSVILLGFQLVFILPSSGYDVTGHVGLTTTTFYGHRVKQKIQFSTHFPTAFFMA